MTFVVILLSIFSSQIIGRQVIELKVCACPGRDAAIDVKLETNESSASMNELRKKRRMKLGKFILVETLFCSF